MEQTDPAASIDVGRPGAFPPNDSSGAGQRTDRNVRL